MPFDRSCIEKDQSREQLFPSSQVPASVVPVPVHHRIGVVIAMMMLGRRRTPLPRRPLADMSDALPVPIRLATDRTAQVGSPEECLVTLVVESTRTVEVRTPESLQTVSSQSCIFLSLSLFLRKKGAGEWKGGE